MTDLKKIAIVMSENDNIAIAKKNIGKGMTVKYLNNNIKILDFIPQGHRFALTDIKKGKSVKQYGYPFGISTGIKKGELISKYNVHNYTVKHLSASCHSERKRRISTDETLHGVYTERSECVQSDNRIDRTFYGYKRYNGQIGTRNFYLVVPTSLCASDVAEKVANALDNDEILKKKYKNIDGYVAAAHTEGCGCNDGEIINRLLLTLKNTIIHPNVGGALIVDLGCEKTNRKVVYKYFGNLEKHCKPFDFISIQQLGGTQKAIETGKKTILKRLKQVNDIARKKCSIKELIVGTKCGASDSFSGITANPVIGKTIDKIICAGGSGILSETPEMLGAEINLIQRMTSELTAKKFINGINYYKKLAKKLNVSIEGNLVPGNEEGGLVNLTLKSLGAVLKGGNSQIVDYVDYAEQVRKQGLSIMNGPGNDLESMTGIVASGANIILFSTGMGATEGNLIVPVIKISSRTELYKKMKDDIDFDAGHLLKNDGDIDKLSNKLLDLTVSIASGKKTKAEILNKRAFQVWSAGKLSL